MLTELPDDQFFFQMTLNSFLPIFTFILIILSSVLIMTVSF